MNRDEHTSIYRFRPGRILTMARDAAHYTALEQGRAASLPMPFLWLIEGRAHSCFGELKSGCGT